MKVEKNSKYFTIAVYTVSSVIVAVTASLVILNLKNICTYIVGFIRSIFALIKPLIIGGAFAYLIDPVVEFYEKKWIVGINKRNEKRKDKRQLQATRTVPVLLGVFTVLAFIGLFILIIAANVKNALGYLVFEDVITSINNYIRYFENVIIHMNTVVNKWMPSESNRNIIIQLYNVAENFISMLLDRFMHAITSLGANTVNIGFGCVIAFYLLVDKHLFLRIWNKIIYRFFSKKWAREIKSIGRDIDYVFSGYIRGQIIDAGIVAVLTSIGLTLVGLDFAIIIGCIVGIFNLIPYFGPIVGEILAGMIGLMGNSPMQGLYAIITVFAIQQIDAFYIVPKVVGESVKLHPVVVLVSILIGGSLFGLMGMLLAVPIAAFIRVIMARYMGDIFEE